MQPNYTCLTPIKHSTSVSTTQHVVHQSALHSLHSFKYFTQPLSIIQYNMAPAYKSIQHNFSTSVSTTGSPVYLPVQCNSVHQSEQRDPITSVSTTQPQYASLVQHSSATLVSATHTIHQSIQHGFRTSVSTNTASEHYSPSMSVSLTQSRQISQYKTTPVPQLDQDNPVTSVGTTHPQYISQYNTT